MTDSKKLKKIIEYAIESGYKGIEPWGKIEEVIINPPNDVRYFIVFESGEGQGNDINTLLFAHDFARAVFGDEDYSVIGCWLYLDGDEEGVSSNKLYRGGGYDGYGDFIAFIGRSWQYHLQQAVISEDPIDYYYQFRKSV